MHTQYHNQQANRHDDEQREAEPAQDHSTGTNPTLDTTVAQVLGDCGGGNGRSVLPKYAN